MENYVSDLIKSINPNGMTDDLWDIIKEDAKHIIGLDIKNDKQRNLFYYLDNFFEDLCDEFKFENKDKYMYIKEIFDILKDKEKIDLNQIRMAFLKIMKKVQKKAYPNTLGVFRTNIIPKRNIDKWVNALHEIHNAIRQGEDKKEVEKKVMEDWDQMEKRDFNRWRNFYEKREHEKYAMENNFFNVKEELPEIPMKKNKTPEEKKRALISRLDAADKLLRDFSNVWPPQVWNRLHQALSDLKREIMMLRNEASIQDRIIRTASIWLKVGFSEGSELLTKIAQPPEDISTQIEKALTGKEYETEEKSKETLPMEEPMTPINEEEMLPPAGAGEELPETLEPLGPQKPTEITEEPKIDENEEIEEPKEEINTEENPYMGSGIEDVISVLEPIVSELKVRATARELSKVDMMLDAQNIASHFPELGEAMSKVLEANTYVVTRLDKMLTKLKGGLSEKDENGDIEKENKDVPEVEMEELIAPENKEILQQEPPVEVIEQQAPEQQAPEQQAPEQKTLITNKKFNLSIRK